MPVERIIGATLDDILRLAVEAILRHGHRVSSTEGSNTELRGVTLHLTNPLARLSRTEARGKPFSCLGELCWYLSGSNATEQIIYYVSRYAKYDEQGLIFGGYGPRLIYSFGCDQLQNVIELLREKPASRQAVIQLFSAADLIPPTTPLSEGKKRDIPCTCTLQCLVREGALHMITYMRSNDAWFGLTHDVFCFTMLQEILARSVNCDLGSYTHIAGSLHIYDKHRPRAEKLSKEGWQSTTQVMPAMPLGDPWPSVRRLMQAEQSIRLTGTFSEEILDGLHPYWSDLIRLLQVYRYYRKEPNADAIKQIQRDISSRVYDMYVANAARGAAAEST